MAQQAFLARQRRIWDEEATPKKRRPRTGHFGSFLHVKNEEPLVALRDALYESRDRLTNLFELWDEDENGTLSRVEFRRAVKILQCRQTKDEIDAFFDILDTDHDGTLSRAELMAVIREKGDSSIETPNEAPPTEAPPPAADEPNIGTIQGCKRCTFKVIRSVYAIASSVTVQTLMYFAFVFIVQMLVRSLRSTDEYYLDKQLSDTLISSTGNANDNDLKEFNNIRRIADIWQWGNALLWPGLLGNIGPTCAAVGEGSFFRSSDMAATTNWSRINSTGDFCNDDRLQDGEGYGIVTNLEATPPLVSDVVDRFNQMDWTDGLRILQVRAASTSATLCDTDTIGGTCYPEPDGVGYVEDTSPFGYNSAYPEQPLSYPFRWRSAEEMGSARMWSASPSSFRGYSGAGYVSFVIPFFSEVRLPDERGTPSNVTDFQPYRVLRGDGRKPRFFCVRLSWDSHHVHQLCDPNDPSRQNRTTGIVRAAIVEFWNDLKRAHYVDARTRMVELLVPLTSNHLGVKSTARLMLEITSSGAVLPSYDTLTRVSRKFQIDETDFWRKIGLAFTCFFCLMELFELLGLEDGAFELDDVINYLSDIWNAMDWVVYILFIFVYILATSYLQNARSFVCDNFCTSIGFRNDHLAMQDARRLKFFLAMTACLQLLKIMKIMAILVPKMGLAPSVLKKAMADLIFFGVVFGISVFAFANVLFIQLGPNMAEFASPLNSFVTLARALFGDFDLDLIIDNSPDYLNTVLFLMYLFCAVFILLSMFLAILGEAQANLRDDQRTQRRNFESKGQQVPSEYGIITILTTLISRGLARVPVLGKNLEKRSVAEEEKKKAEATRVEEQEQKLDVQQEQASASSILVPLADRLEARQLKMGDKIDELVFATRSARRSSSFRGCQPSGAASPGQPSGATSPLDEAGSPGFGAGISGLSDSGDDRLERLEQTLLHVEKVVMEMRHVSRDRSSTRKGRLHHHISRASSADTGNDPLHPASGSSIEESMSSSAAKEKPPTRTLSMAECLSSFRAEEMPGSTFTAKEKPPPNRRRVRKVHLDA